MSAPRVKVQPITPGNSGSIVVQSASGRATTITVRVDPLSAFGRPGNPVVRLGVDGYEVDIPPGDVLMLCARLQDALGKLYKLGVLG